MAPESQWLKFLLGIPTAIYLAASGTGFPEGKRAKVWTSLPPNLYQNANSCCWRSTAHPVPRWSAACPRQSTSAGAAAWQSPGQSVEDIPLATGGKLLNHQKVTWKHHQTFKCPIITHDNTWCPSNANQIHCSYSGNCLCFCFNHGLHNQLGKQRSPWTTIYQFDPAKVLCPLQGWQSLVASLPRCIYIFCSGFVILTLGLPKLLEI